MRTRVVIALVAAVGATLLIGGVAAANGNPLVGTWHQRDAGHSNIFYFVDEPIGGVYPILFFDDGTGEIVCGDNGPMMASGFATEIDANTFDGSFGNYWCPDNGDGYIAERPSDVIGNEWRFTLFYDPDTDTISGGIGECIGYRQHRLDDPNEALEEVAEGKYPPVVFPPPGCDE